MFWFHIGDGKVGGEWCWSSSSNLVDSSLVRKLSSTWTCRRFLPGQNADGIQMVSCGADKSIIFRWHLNSDKIIFIRAISIIITIVIRDVNAESEGISLSRANHIVGKTTLYDMELDRCVITLVIIINITISSSSSTSSASSSVVCDGGRVQMWKTWLLRRPLMSHFTLIYCIIRSSSLLSSSSSLSSYFFWHCHHFHCALSSLY